MNKDEFSGWLDNVFPLYEGLTQTVVNIIGILLRGQRVQFLNVTGRTKDKVSAADKIIRKGYKNPKQELTDLSGIRIILYSESDVEFVSKIIENSFNVDYERSSNKDDLLAKDQIGYRSVHYVCDLGDARVKLPEFSSFSKLKFEFQIRTVLQHAWAELSHDRNYKFSKTLPKKLERKLYLYAGMLEIVDNGLNDLSKEIDNYITEQADNAEKGYYDQDIDSISLKEYIKKWASDANLNVGVDTDNNVDNKAINELVSEIKQYGLKTIEDVHNIKPLNYEDKIQNINTNILGVVRDWMLINDFRKFHKNVSFNWVLVNQEEDVLQSYFSSEDWSELCTLFEVVDNSHDGDWP